MAFPFIGLQVDNYLKEKKDLGIFIFDEHRSIIDIEQSLKSLRLTDDTVMHLDAVIEKGFFVDSSKSFALQLVDLLLYYIRKYEEFKIGKKVSTIHQEVFEQITAIAVNLDKHPKGLQILDWVDGQVKK